VTIDIDAYCRPFIYFLVFGPEGVMF
jgi:hypothetical protein